MLSGTPSLNRFPKRDQSWLVTGPVLYSANVNLFHSWMRSAKVLPSHLIYPVHFLDRRRFMVETKDLIDYAQYKKAYVAHIWINIDPSRIHKKVINITF